MMYLSIVKSLVKRLNVLGSSTLRLNPAKDSQVWFEHRVIVCIVTR